MKSKNAAILSTAVMSAVVMWFILDVQQEQLKYKIEKILIPDAKRKIELQHIRAEKQKDTLVACDNALAEQAKRYPNNNSNNVLQALVDEFLMDFTYRKQQNKSKTAYYDNSEVKAAIQKIATTEFDKISTSDSVISNAQPGYFCTHNTAANIQQDKYIHELRENLYTLTRYASEYGVKDCVNPGILRKLMKQTDNMEDANALYGIKHTLEHSAYADMMTAERRLQKLDSINNNYRSRLMTFRVKRALKTL